MAASFLGLRRSRGEFSRLAVGAALVLVAGLGGIDVLGPVPLSEPPVGVRTNDGGPPSQPPALAISPGAWTLVAGQSVRLTASLSGLDGCLPGTMRVTWALDGYAAVEGILNSSEGSSVAYTTFTGNGGSVAVAASADATILCWGTEYTTSASGSAAVTILPSLTLAGVSTAQNPAVPGETVDLQWSVTGGLAPYTVSVDFGDGTGTSLTMGSAGPAALGHAFGAGRFSPVIHVVDATGASATAPAPNPEMVAFDLAAAILGPGSSVDAGVEFSLSAVAGGGFPPYSLRWSDSTGASGVGATWNHSVSSTGPCTVTLKVTDVAGMTYSVQRTLSVEPRPNLTIGARAPAWDVGLPLPLWATVSGGVAPYSLNVSTNGSPTVDSRTSASGSLETSVVGSSPGPIWVSAVVVDALGVASSVTRSVARLFAAPALHLSSTSARGEVGVPVQLNALETGGAPPVNWTVLPSLPVLNATAPVGELAGPGIVHWSGAFVTSGNVTLTILATDAAGATTLANVSLSIAPALSASLQVNGPGFHPGVALPLLGTVEGGVAPYVASFDLTDLENRHMNLSAPGGVGWSAHPMYPGYVEIRFEVTDSAGRSTVGQATVFVAPNSSTPSPTGTSGPPPGFSDAAGWALGLGVLGSLAGVAVVPRIWRRRRARPGTSPESVAMVAVRRILQGSDGLERPTLEFLAEEEGIAALSVGLALERWRRAGRIRGEPGLDGDELLFWTEPTPPPGRGPAPAGEAAL